MASGTMMTRPDRIAFLVTSRSGLGHLRRAASIAAALNAARSGLRIDLHTNAPPAGLTGADLAAFATIEVMETPRMAQCAANAGSGVVVADTMVPQGIEDVRVRRALILRETPEDRLGRFALPNGLMWDLMLVPNPPEHWLPESTTRMARRRCATGWIYRQPRWPGPPPRARPMVLAAMGGGGTVETAVPLARQMDAVIDAARRMIPEPFDVVQALGPRAPAEAVLASADRTVDPGGDLNDYFAAADAVISTAGYNSILELAITTTPALMMTIPRTFDDQVQRARAWGQLLGMAHDSEDPSASAAWLASMLTTRHRRKAIDIGPSGAGAAARAILDLLA
jgi:predicted glycosyltransferase